MWQGETINPYCFLVKRAADEVSSEAKKPRIEVKWQSFLSQQLYVN